MYAPPAVVQIPSPFRRLFRLELMVVVTVMTAIAAMLFDRLLYYQEYAEKVAMETTVLEMRSSLNVAKARMMISVSEGGVPRQLTDNPINLLESPPAKYAGEFAGVAPENAGDGIWYYDAEKRQLAYRPNLKRHFVAGSGAGAEARFQLVRELPARGGVVSADTPVWEGYVIARVQPYVWF